MSQPNEIKNWVRKSPWLDSKSGNLFLDEFRLIDDLKIDPWLEHVNSYFKPLEIYRWIHRHHGASLLFKGLARFAPMFPVIAYNRQIAVWISPPPSGMGNAIYMVIGHDKSGKLRLVGGNYFSRPSRQNGDPLSDTDFFAQYDVADDYSKQSLVLDAVTKSIRADDESLICNISRHCEHFHTMAVYITVLTGDCSMFHAAKAVVEGNKPADYSYEWFGEIQ